MYRCSYHGRLCPVKLDKMSKVTGYLVSKIFFFAIETILPLKPTELPIKSLGIPLAV
jgi:hypothetical protein